MDVFLTRQDFTRFASIWNLRTFLARVTLHRYCSRQDWNVEDHKTAHRVRSLVDAVTKYSVCSMHSKSCIRYAFSCTIAYSSSRTTVRTWNDVLANLFTTNFWDVLIPDVLGIVR